MKNDTVFVCIVVYLSTFLIGFTLGAVKGPVLEDRAIDAFKNGPVCIEREVGLDSVKNCYEIVNLKDKPTTYIDPQEQVNDLCSIDPKNSICNKYKR